MSPRLAIGLFVALLLTAGGLTAMFFILREQPSHDAQAPVVAPVIEPYAAAVLGSCVLQQPSPSCADPADGVRCEAACDGGAARACFTVAARLMTSDPGRAVTAFTAVREVAPALYCGPLIADDAPLAQETRALIRDHLQHAAESSSEGAWSRREVRYQLDTDGTQYATARVRWSDRTLTRSHCGDRGRLPPVFGDRGVAFVLRAHEAGAWPALAELSDQSAFAVSPTCDDSAPVRERCVADREACLSRCAAGERAYCFAAAELRSAAASTVPAEWTSDLPPQQLQAIARCAGDWAWCRHACVEEGQRGACLHILAALRSRANDANDSSAPLGAVQGCQRSPVPCSDVSRPSAQIRAGVRAHLGRIRHCYERGLRDAPELAGRVTTHFMIVQDGRVPAAVVLESTLGERTVDRCIRRAVESLRFPEIDDEGFVVVTYPFTLRSE